ncbi:MAG: tRNA glutamyl-Q(34) synthetase GluQRS [Sutterella sp.]|nr:tRNA glutamyl-Q(34) synthetase GluQRS [Sutterella sp.]
MTSYRGRFAPSPTGLLHAGSLVAAMASYLDARAHDGVWLVRIEDIDPPRDVPGADKAIIDTLRRLGLNSDEPVLWQHDRYDAYAETLKRLRRDGRVYGCACSRREAAERALALGLPAGVYPGTCRSGTGGRPVRAWRFLTNGVPVTFDDRLAGSFTQNVEKEAGDFVLKRADGLWAYQLAVVADDLYQGVTDIVRGADLIDNTPRQIMLYEALGARPPRYMHLPLVLNSDGQKLSKQQGAVPLNPDDLRGETERAWRHLGFEPIGADSQAAFWKTAARCWKERLEARGVF